MTYIISKRTGHMGTRRRPISSVAITEPIPPIIERIGINQVAATGCDNFSNIFMKPPNCYKACVYPHVFMDHLLSASLQAIYHQESPSPHQVQSCTFLQVADWRGVLIGFQKKTFHPIPGALGNYTEKLRG